PPRAVRDPRPDRRGRPPSFAAVAPREPWRDRLAASAERDAMKPGDTLGHYRIVDRLGEGGMGEVYRAHDAQLDREVAIKILSPQLARDPEALARFEREALSVAKLSHPNILAIYELGRDADTVFVVSELVDGETLRARLAGG